MPFDQSVTASCAISVSVPWIALPTASGTQWLRGQSVSSVGIEQDEPAFGPLRQTWAKSSSRVSGSGPPARTSPATGDGEAQGEEREQGDVFHRTFLSSLVGVDRSAARSDDSAAAAITSQARASPQRW